MIYRILKRVLLTALILLPCSAAQPPNILLIVSEDNGQELGCYGDPYVRTPVLDQLASEGVLFKNAYVAQAGCSQSRAAFLTGLYPHQNGQIGLATWKFRMYDENTPNLVRSLNAVGYRTGLIGKLHVNPESAFPFDFKAIPSANFSRKEQDQYAVEAERFMNADDAPFFLSVNYPDAHRPFIPQVDGIPAQPLTGEEVTSLPYFGIDTPELRQQTADYYNCMSRLDTLIGDLLQSLDRTGKASNTVIAYIGDHGADMLRGKRSSYEGGTRVPFIVKWPGKSKVGLVSTDLVSLVDIAPTFLELAGAPPIPHLTGYSLIPLLKGESTHWRKYLFTEYHLHSAHNYFPQRTVRDSRFKLIRNLLPGKVNPGYAFTNSTRFFENMDEAIHQSPDPIRSAYLNMERPPAYELYDLEQDPFEFNNLASDPAYRPTQKRLQQALHTWRQQNSDPLLNQQNVLRLKAEVDASLVDGQPDKSKLTLTYPEYFFEE